MNWHRHQDHAEQGFRKTFQETSTPGPRHAGILQARMILQSVRVDVNEMAMTKAGRDIRQPRLSELISETGPFEDPTW